MGTRYGSFSLALILVLVPLVKFVDSKCVLFNFGDSNSDNGGFAAGLGFYLGPPSGRTFFNQTTGRFSDGRLYIDFICEGLKIKFLSHYLESSGSDFTHGVNFAVAGASTVTNGTFPLATQVLQFLHFKNKTRELRPQGRGSLIGEDEFRDAMYSFDIGQNDISIGFTANLTYQQVLETLPTTISRMKDAILSIIANGGRNIWIYNTGPLGCLPQTLSLRKKENSTFYSVGCLSDYNNAAMAFNALLDQLCHDLRSQFNTTTSPLFALTCMLSSMTSLLTPQNMVFEHPLMACCGHGGPPYNYRNLMTCGQPTATACPVGTRAVSWDGVHYTEAANEIIASKILSARYSKPSIKLSCLCH